MWADPASVVPYVYSGWCRVLGDSVLCFLSCKVEFQRGFPVLTLFHSAHSEKLVPPRVTLSSRIGDNGNCIIILTCVAGSRGDTVTYSWTPLGPRTVTSHGGSVLSVSLRPEDSVSTFTCIIKNQSATAAPARSQCHTFVQVAGSSVCPGTQANTLNSSSRVDRRWRRNADSLQALGRGE